MSFDHQAYAFTWHAFSGEMLPWFAQALEPSDRRKLLCFIRDHVEACTGPYAGKPLTRAWEEDGAVDPSDIRLLVDFALTKYYAPSESRGLSAR